MASEILAIPEDDVRSVIAILRAGMAVTHAQHLNIPPHVYEQLQRWCEEEQAYLDDDDPDADERSP